MNSQRILLIDNASDRKDRINALKQHGYSVFPALRMEEARSRCMRGGYDLIVVNAGDEAQQAVEYCDAIRKQCPRQQVLMCSLDNTRDYAVPPDVDSLVKAVDSTLHPTEQPTDLASAA
jgi:DNA-binding response OmpR family regulator